MKRRTLLKSAAGMAGGAALSTLALHRSFAQDAGGTLPDVIANPHEVHGSAAVPVIGRLPGTERMYMLPAGTGEHYRVGSFLVSRLARPVENGGRYELLTFAGKAGAAMPAHARLSSHAALVVIDGEVELVLGKESWRMFKGDVANIPPGTAVAWTMRSDGARFALYAIGDRAGAAFTAMGVNIGVAQVPGAVEAIGATALANASIAGDFQLRPGHVADGAPVAVTNTVLPEGAVPYVVADGGGERFGDNVFVVRNRHTNGQFLLVMSEGAPSPGVGAHFHARHTEDFFALDGETLGWANGKAVPLHTGDYLHTPPRHLHGFRMTQSYNRFVGFLTPGIFENFFPTVLTVDPASPDVFSTIRNAARGPDGYPLDVFGPTYPLPPQDPVWTEGTPTSALELKLQYHRHALICSDRGRGGEPASPQLLKALRHKRRWEAAV